MGGEVLTSLVATGEGPATVGAAFRNQCVHFKLSTRDELRGLSPYSTTW